MYSILNIDLIIYKSIYRFLIFLFIMKFYIYMAIYIDINLDLFAKNGGFCLFFLRKRHFQGF
jgi:small neutral amino acid transporter SnatA (MarC family)